MLIWQRTVFFMVLSISVDERWLELIDNWIVFVYFWYLLQINNLKRVPHSCLQRHFFNQLFVYQLNRGVETAIPLNLILKHLEGKGCHARLLFDFSSAFLEISSAKVDTTCFKFLIFTSKSFHCGLYSVELQFLSLLSTLLRLYRLLLHPFSEEPR